MEAKKLDATVFDSARQNADPDHFIDLRFVRELEQSGIIEQLYSQTR
jgi:hypothetical protein